MLELAFVGMFLFYCFGVWMGKLTERQKWHREPYPMHDDLLWHTCDTCVPRITFRVGAKSKADLEVARLWHEDEYHDQVVYPPTRRYEDVMDYLYDCSLPARDVFRRVVAKAQAKQVQIRLSAMQGDWQAFHRHFKRLSSIGSARQ